MAGFGARSLVVASYALFSTGLLVTCAIAPVPAMGQTQENLSAVDGYITAMHAPDLFAINKGKQVRTTSQTTYSWSAPAGAKSRPAAASDLEVGVYVKATGQREGKQLAAQSIVILDPAEKRVKGFGLIERVIGTGTEPVIEADGYRIRITPATDTQFSGKLKKLADVRAGAGIHYEGKRDASGDLVAEQAAFYEGITGEKSAARMKQESAPPDAIPPQARLIDARGNFVGPHQKVRMENAGGVCGWHRLSSNSAMQQRVWRVGMQVVPAFQKALPFDAKERIRFRFYVIDDSEFRDAFGCDWGLILVPEQVVARLTTDDMLAAVLAGGVAAQLQWQGAEVSPDKSIHIAEGAAITAAEVAAEAASPWGAFGVVAAAQIVNPQILRVFREQQGRVALALMADAGYDPWAAPEAWRLLAPKKLPASPDTLPYPDLSGYQLSFLHLQYKQGGTLHTN